MGEDIEIKDIHGNLVKVPLYPTIAACGRALELQSQTTVPLGDGEEVVIERQRVGLDPPL